MKKLPLIPLCAAVALGANAQYLQKGDIETGTSADFYKYVKDWGDKQKITDDDNFYIARQKPRARFTNKATQVKTDYVNGERRIQMWVPVNAKDANGWPRSAMPSGRFESECFTMWSYIDNYSDWSASIAQLYGGWADVAHKNGVAVAGMLWGDNPALSQEQQVTFKGYSEMDPMMAAKVLRYFGNDGLTYNSEFSTTSRGTYTSAMNRTLMGTVHENLMSNLTDLYNELPNVDGYTLRENVWYDGTQYSSGSIRFDGGLSTSNADGWYSPEGKYRSSLFFNYNWNSYNLQTNDALASRGDVTRLYAGINMQGGSAKASSWRNFDNSRIGLGLWGAHDYNYFWNARGDMGGAPETIQQCYQLTLENYFTGSSFNPLNPPQDVASYSHAKYNHPDFHGLSRYRSAASAMSWDLGVQPFITNFNVGNGRFFNYEGQRMNDIEWYNIGVQDYMPTWRWWWATSFVGKTPATGMTAAFDWSDAYMGGSCLKISGSTASKQYLHLLKTKYALKDGDVITLRYKLLKGSADAYLSLSAEGAETTELATPFITDATRPNSDDWQTVTLTVGTDVQLSGKTLAMVALRFDNASGVQVRLGEFSVKRGSYPAPTAPEVTRAEIIRNHYKGIDIKMVFNVPNKVEDLVNGRPCYNDEVNNAFYKIYTQEENGEPVLYGITTTWAAMLYSVPCSSSKIRVGLSAVNFDYSQESEIVWGKEWLTTPAERIYSDEISINKEVITPDEPFTLSTVDPLRTFIWEIYDNTGKKMAESGESVSSWTCEGLPAAGYYDLKIIGPNNSDKSSNASITLSNKISVTASSAGRLPEILSITANGSKDGIEIEPTKSVKFEYTGREANGASSRGLYLGGYEFGVVANDLGLTGVESFSVTGWIKMLSLPEGTSKFFDIRASEAGWTAGEAGWQSSEIKADGSIAWIRNGFGINAAGTGGASITVEAKDLPTNTFFQVGKWTHFAFVYTLSGNSFKRDLYIDGKLINTTTSDKNTVFNAAEGRTAQWWTDYKVRNRLSIGGGRSANVSDEIGGKRFEGVLDDFSVWNKPMTAEEVKASMDGLDKDNLPSGVLSFWDFETVAETVGVLPAAGGSKAVDAYYYNITGTDTSGQGYPVNTEHSYTAGCPFLQSDAFPIETVADFQINGAKVTEASGNDTAGSATATYDNKGVFSGKLTLSNELGSHTVTLPVVNVKDLNAIEGVGADSDNIKTYVVDEMLFIMADIDGEYQIAAFNMNGVQMTERSMFIEAGSTATVTFGVPAGVYLIQIMRDGKAVGAFKVLKK